MSNAMNENWSEVLVLETTWKVRKRYESLTPPQFGSFGLVCFAHDKETNQKVAIKKISRPFDAPRFAKLSYRELCLLKFVSHDNLIKLLDTFTTANTADEMQDFYLVTNYMETDLKSILQFQKLEKDQISFLIYQLFRGLLYLHSCNIIHRDLKPSNITVNQDCELRIIDFGLARTEQLEMSPYVVTRWYRAPDVIIQQQYSRSVDLWSVGCILAESFSSLPLFPGQDHHDQLNRILKVVGFPPAYLIDEFVESARSYFNEMKKKPKREDFYKYFSNIKDPNAIDLLEKLLELDPKKRITCEQAIKHPFVSIYHDPEDEPVGKIYENKFENEDHLIEDWKKEIFKEIQSFEPETNNNNNK